MAMKMNKLLFALPASVLVSLMLLLLKLFTTEVGEPGEDTTGVALRSQPSLDNWEYSKPGHRYVYLAGPDHTYVGQQFYPFLVSAECTCGAALMTGALVILFALRREG